MQRSLTVAGHRVHDKPEDYGPVRTLQRQGIEERWQRRGRPGVELIDGVGGATHVAACLLGHTLGHRWMDEESEPTQPTPKDGRRGSTYIMLFTSSTAMEPPYPLLDGMVYSPTSV